MAFYLVKRPEGTRGFDAGITPALTNILSGATDAFKQNTFRRAAEEQGLEPSFIQDPRTGEFSTQYSAPKKSTSDTKTDILLALSGLGDMSKVFDEPRLEVGEAAGGKVLTPPGATVKDGFIVDRDGNIIGETGEESLPASSDAARSSLRQSILEDEIARAALGLPAKKEPKPEKAPSFEQSLSAAVKGDRSFDELREEFPTSRHIKDIDLAEERSLPLEPTLMEKIGRFFGIGRDFAQDKIEDAGDFVLDKASNIRDRAAPVVDKVKSTLGDAADNFSKGTNNMIERAKRAIKKEKPEFNDATKTVIKNIKTEDDLQELMDNEEDYQEAGVDMRLIRGFFKLTP